MRISFEEFKKTSPGEVLVFDITYEKGTKVELEDWYPLLKFNRVCLSFICMNLKFLSNKYCFEVDLTLKLKHIKLNDDKVKCQG